LPHILASFSKRHSRAHLYEYLDAALEQHVTPASQCLNIGAGGAVAERLQRHHLSYKEIDVDSARHPDIVADMSDLHMIPDNSIDAIICIEVLEHVTEPARAVKEARRILKPGGVFIGSTPFMLPIHDEPHDYFRYTRHGITYLFSAFTELQLIERNSYLESSAVIPLRLFNVGTRTQKMYAYLLSPFIVSAALCATLLSRLVTNHQSATGYFFVFSKPRQ